MPLLLLIRTNFDSMLVDYLLRPAPNVRKLRHGAGIAILTIYACLLLILALSYFRLVYTVTAKPGYTPQGPQWHAQRSRERRPSGARQPAPRHVDPEKGNGVLEAPSTPNEGLPASPYAPVSSAYGPINDTVIPSLQEFYMRDVFTCEKRIIVVKSKDAFVRWITFAPGRQAPAASQRLLTWLISHCRVGGIVSESSQKFFVLFVVWGAIFWVFTMIFMAKFVAETKVSQSLRPIQAGPSLLVPSIWHSICSYQQLSGELKSTT
ncbi:MAG: hypothetical protein Q9212_000628 [Teloschistes hypoglaucus]